MIKKLQKRIAFTLAGILILIMAGIEFFLYFGNYYYYAQYQKEMMTDIADEYRKRDVAKESVGGENSYLDAEWYLPVWVFQIEKDGGLTLTQKSSGTEQKGEKVLQRAEEILERDKETGIYKRSWYLQKENILVVMDDSDTIRYYEQQAAFFLIGGIAGLLFILFCSLRISRWLVRPAAQAFEQQRQFISDAGHELKTPLAVIGANAQRLQGEIGENKWLHYILEENTRMGKLLKELLVLARVEDIAAGEHFERVNLSRIVTGVLLPYESIAFEKEVEFWMDIQEDVFIQGEKEHLKQAVVVLVDNAFAHVSAKGEVKAKLTKKGKRIEIVISNTGEEIPKDEQQKIFQRFYRVDKSRSRAENRYGLGLAIAAGIVKRHDGRIDVSSENGITAFTIKIEK